MIPPIYPQNVDSTSPNVAEPISSHTHCTSHIVLLLTLFSSDPPPFGHLNLFNRLDPPPPNHKKMDKEPVDEFLWRDVCCHMGIKNSSPTQKSFCEYT